MQKDEHGNVITDQKDEIVVPKDGEADPLDEITDIEALRNAAKANRSIASRYKAKAKAPEVKPSDQIIKKEETPQVKAMDILQDEAFDLYREGYSNNDIKIILANGGRKILEDKNHPLTLGLAAKREQTRAEEAAGRTSNSAGASEVERKYTPEQLKNMSAAELEKILPHAN